VTYVGDQSIPSGTDDDAVEDFVLTDEPNDTSDEDCEGWPHFNDGGEV